MPVLIVSTSVALVIMFIGINSFSTIHLRQNIFDRDHQIQQPTTVPEPSNMIGVVSIGLLVFLRNKLLKH